jgi:hypothetical protein
VSVLNPTRSTPVACCSSSYTHTYVRLFIYFFHLFLGEWQWQLWMPAGIFPWIALVVAGAAPGGVGFGCMCGMEAHVSSHPLPGPCPSPPQAKVS